MFILQGISKSNEEKKMADIKKGILAVLKELLLKQKTRKFHSAVILAAGNGVRFGDENGKHFVLVQDIPVVIRSVRAFEESPLIDEIIVVTREDDIGACEQLLKEAKFTKIKCVIAGGADRQASAKNGFEAINPHADFVSIHDAARCLITPSIIADVANEAYKHGAAVAAEKAVDTVKRADGKGFITETMDREFVWLAKTPQTFMADMYRAAVYTAEKDGIRATDDCALVERLGFKIKLVNCGWENIKITFPDDRLRAEHILKQREEQEVT